jgi:hypothetical protein
VRKRQWLSCWTGATFLVKISLLWPSHRATLSRSLESPPPLIAALRPLRFPPISPCQPTYLPWHLETKHEKVKFARQHFRAWGNNTGWLARLRGHRNDDGPRCDSEVANQTQALRIHQFDSGQSVDMSQESLMRRSASRLQARITHLSLAPEASALAQTGPCSCLPAGAEYVSTPRPSSWCE